MANVKITEKGEFTFWQTLWHYTRRFLRTIVPQIPALMSWAEYYFTQDQLPYFVAAGGLLTVLDKMFRDKGWYSSAVRVVIRK